VSSGGSSGWSKPSGSYGVPSSSYGAPGGHSGRFINMALLFRINERKFEAIWKTYQKIDEFFSYIS
jgi:hypothetical protein